MKLNRYNPVVDARDIDARLLDQKIEFKCFSPYNIFLKFRLIDISKNYLFYSEK